MSLMINQAIEGLSVAYIASLRVDEIADRYSGND